MDPCPARERLELLTAKKLAADELAAVETHVGGCTACQHTLSEMSAFRPTKSWVPAHDGAHPRTHVHNPASGPAAGAEGGESVSPERQVGGRYRLLKRIGEGGMGEVWVAEQSEPVTRQVALKLIKTGMNTRQVLARFEAERQALALMDHPHIARILDGGQTEGGQPYFVMELVNGAHITTYADRHRLPVRQRLGLFVQVCQAIQHAHQKGIIHRDVKPSNVLVTEADGRSLVKVIDFGLARAVERPHDGHTEVGSVLGTPEYMSPEQASVTNPDIDTRTDIYSLGAILFELLTGTPPLYHQSGRGRSLIETLRAICEAETPVPSTVLARRAAPADTADPRTAPTPRLVSEVRGELDWIVVKCLEKDRARRYDDAGGLARDIQRYLNGEAVEACPPTLRYRLKTYWRRNKRVAAVASLVLFSLLAGLAGTTAALLEANRQRREAEDATRRVVEANFLRVTEERRQVLEGGIAEAVESLVAVASAFDTWPNLSRADFASFTRRTLQSHPEIQALEWVPRVPAGERPAVEAAARRDGLTGFHFREFDTALGTRPAAARAEYFPVLYFEPADLNQPAGGLDLFASVPRRRALQKAVETSRPIASEPIRLVQERGEQYGFLLFLPVFHGANRATPNEPPAVRGFAVAVFRTEDLVNRILSDLGHREVELTIHDLDPGGPDKPVYLSPREPAPSGVRVVHHDIEVGGRTWRLTFRPR